MSRTVHNTKGSGYDYWGKFYHSVPKIDVGLNTPTKRKKTNSTISNKEMAHRIYRRKNKQNLNNDFYEE